jgi:hypothetical protein
LPPGGGDPKHLSQVDQQVAAWAKGRGVTLVGTEVIINTPLVSGLDTNLSPEAILRQFAQQEGLSDEILSVGLQLLQEVNDDK